MDPITQQILEQLKAMANPANVAGMARYGINPYNTLGVSIPALRAIARREKPNHELALQLWESGVHEARILAALVADPKLVDDELMERWVVDFDSWDVCDQVCSNLFDKTPLAYSKAIEWAGRHETYVKRAGFVLMAALAVHDKRASDQAFEAFFPVILRESYDERNFVKKAVNWALRGIGKRNRTLNVQAIHLAQQIALLDSRTARWIARNALKELTSRKIQAKLG